MLQLRSGRRRIPVIAVVLFVAVTIVLVALLSSIVGGCAYTGPSLRSTFFDRGVSVSSLATSIGGWNRSTRVSSNASYQDAVRFDFACVNRTGHGWVDVAPIGGGPNSTAEIFMYSNSEHPRSYNWFDDPFGPPVDEIFQRDKAHVSPCFQELSAILTASLGGPADFESWGPFGLC